MKFTIISLFVALVTIGAALVCGKLWFEYVISSDMPDWLKYLILR